MLLETPLQGVLIFFAPRALRLLGALGYAAINSQRTKQHICKLAQPRPQPKFVKELFSCPRTHGYFYLWYFY